MLRDCPLPVATPVLLSAKGLLLGSMAGKVSLMLERSGRGVLVTGTQRWLAAECNQNSVSHTGLYSIHDIMNALWEGLEPRPTLALAPIDLNQVFEVAMPPGSHDLVQQWLFNRNPTSGWD